MSLTIFWVLYSLAGLAFVVWYTDYVLPWVQRNHKDAIFYAQMEVIASNPIIKTILMGILFVVWPVLFLVLAAVGTFFGVLWCYDSVVFAYHKFMFKRKWMKRFDAVQNISKAEMKKNRVAYRASINATIKKHFSESDTNA